MKVNALDHINIITADLAETAKFYVEMFGLEARRWAATTHSENRVVYV
jgi:catechol 2,3-dioxygenase-like lactoylglutathione lyase family enzyme